FFNYEEFRESSTVNTFLNTVPVDAYRNGDFSGVLARTGRTIPGAAGTDGLGNVLGERMIFDPATERLAPNGSRVRLQFPGNIIPANRLDPSALKVQALIL